MFERLKVLFFPLQETVTLKDKPHLLLTATDFALLSALTDVLAPFKSFTKILSGENYPTGSLIKPIIQKLKKYILNDAPPKDYENPLITEVRKRMKTK